MRYWLIYVVQHLDLLIQWMLLVGAGAFFLAGIALLVEAGWLLLRPRWRRWRIHKQLAQERRQLGAALAQAKAEMKRKYPKLTARKGERE